MKQIVGIVLVLCVACLGAVTISCGQPETASPEHLGTWYGTTPLGSDLTIDVSGTPGHYAAKYAETKSATGKGSDMDISFTGGKVDAAGNMQFDAVSDYQLTLGPVSGDQMTAYIASGSVPVEMTK